MAQRQFRSDDTDAWQYAFGTGADGEYSSSGNATWGASNASCSGTSGDTALTLGAASSFANGDLVLIHQSRGTGVGNWELNKIASGGGSTSITLAHTLINTYTDSGASQAQITELKEYTSFTQNSGHTLTAPAWDGNVGGIIAFLCSGTTTITGNLSATGKGFLLGAGSAANVSSESATATQGEGSSGAGSTSINANGNGGGGGGGTAGAGKNGPGGAGGGNAAAGTNGSASSGTGGTGGGAVGAAGLTTAFFGGGGGGGKGESIGDQEGGNGGNGGGMIFIFSNAFTVSGTLVASGNAGSNGGSYGSGTIGGGGGGGGAGGSILIKGKTLTLGTNLLVANYGAGGLASGSSNGGNGGAGSVGRIHADYSISISGSTNPSIDSRQDLTITDSTFVPKIIWF